MKRYLFLLITMVLGATINASSVRATTLEEAYTSALAFHESIQIAGETVVQADSRVDQAWSYLYPRITALGSYTRYNDVLPPSGAFIFQPLGQLQGAVVLTQPLYTGGRTLAALRLTQTQQESSQEGPVHVPADGARRRCRSILRSAQGPEDRDRQQGCRAPHAPPSTGHRTGGLDPANQGQRVGASPGELAR